MSVTDNIKFSMTIEDKNKFKIWRYKYINHLIKLNQLVLPLIDAIKKMMLNAVIIVASDHGSRILCNIVFKEARKESFENISFVYFQIRIILF